MRTLLRSCLAWLILVPLLSSCDEPAPALDDASVQDAALPPCEGLPPIPRGMAEGHATPLGASAGQVRAGRLVAGDLPADPRGLLAWRAGDYVLANDHLAIVIEDVGLSDDFNPHGGQIVGLSMVEGGALTRPATFGEASFTFGATTLATQSVSVLADGSDGGDAIVRATGRLAPLGFLGFVSGVLGGDAPGIEVAIDYVLSPGSDALAVEVTIANDTPRAAVFARPLITSIQRNRMPLFTPGAGFVVQESGTSPWLGFVEPLGASYAIEAAEGEVRVLLEQANLLFIQLPRFSAAACMTTERSLARVHVGGPGLDGLLQTLAETPAAELTGSVEQSDGAPAAGARVYASDSAGVLVSRTTTDETGAFSLHVPAGEVNLRAWRRGDAASAQMSVTAPGSALLRLGDTGSVALTISDEADAPLDAFVQLLPMDDAPWEPPNAYGEHAIVRGAAATAYGINGVASLRVPAGAYRMIVSRGFEYEMVSRDIVVAAGAELSEAVALAHTVPTPGVMCGDFHVHTHRSFDAEDDARLKVHAAAASGLDVVLRSDHEYVADFEPLIAELDVQDSLFGVVSLELTTFVYGHFGVFPLDVDPTQRNSGAIEWVDRTPDEVLSEAASRMGTQGRSEVIINHPRAGFALLGYFDAVDFDPSVGMPTRMELWWDDVALIEVFNESDYDANESGVVRDWLSLLRQGRRVFAMGSSDSHEVSRTALGYPRTCLSLGLDTAPELRAVGAGRVRDAAVAGTSTVVGGVFVEALARSGVGPGQTLMGAAATESIEVVVRAPSWVDVDRLRVFVDGELSETIAIGPDDGDPLDAAVRFVADIDVAVAASGSFVHFVADGEDDLSPVYPGRRPFGVTNPLFLRR